MAPLRDVVRARYGAWAGGLKAALVALALAGPVAAEDAVIAALGDSLTQGYGLAPESGFVPQLERWLKARGHDVRLVNAGVSGDTTAGGLSRAAWTLTPDVGGLIVALGGNDLLRGIDPAASRANLRGILEAAEAAGVPVLLIGMVAPGNFGPDYKAAFDAMYPELAEAFGALYVPSFLGPLLEESDRQAAIARFMQSDAIHPNAEGIARIVEAIGPEVEALLARIP